MGRRSRRSSGGVSSRQVGPGKFKLAWRQWEAMDLADGEEPEAKSGNVELRNVDGQQRWCQRVQRYRTVVGAQTRDKLAADIRVQLATKGFYEPPARPEDRVCNVEQMFAAWMRHKHGRGVKDATIAVYASVFKRFGSTARKIHGLGAEDTITSDIMTRDTMDRAQTAWRREGLSDDRRYDLARIIYEAWRWGSDDPDSWPGVPVPPRDPSTVLPQPPVRRAPPPAPTWEEMDSVLRRAKESRSRDLWMILAVQRCTGLRIGQVLGIRTDAVDLARRTLRVEIGKSRREEADQRVVPLSADAVAVLKPRVEALGPGELVFPSASGKVRSVPGAAIKDILKAAEKAEEVRAETWRPRGRKPRTSHWFRAGFQTCLSRDGTPDAVIKALVGHTDGSTMRSHYVSVHDSLFDAMREAVDEIPLIRWEAEEAGDVVPLRRAGSSRGSP